MTKRNVYDCETVKKQIEQAWKEREQKEEERIETETALAWKLHNEEIDAVEKQAEMDAIAEIQEYLKLEEDDDETSNLPNDKSRKRIRRKANIDTKKRIMRESDIAVKSLKRRERDDANNFVKKHEITKNAGEGKKETIIFYEARGIKSRAARGATLMKKAEKLNC